MPPRAEGGSLPLLLQYWRVAVRWRWVIAAVVVGTMILGAIITMLMTPKYTATATIEISRQQDRVVQVQDVTPESSGADLEFYQTQYSLLTARSLADRVAADLKLADSTAFFDTMRVKIPGPGLFAGPATVRSTPTERADRQRRAVDVLLKNLTVTPIRGSSLVELSFTSPDAALSSRVTNAWTSHFIESNLARRFDATSYARKFLETRLEQLRRRLEESERQLVNYAATQQIISIPSAGGTSGEKTDRPIVADDLATLNAALAQATADRIKAESRVQGAGASGTSDQALANGAISALRQRRAELSAEYAKMLVQFEPGYPEARALQRQVAELDRSINREESRVREGASTGYQQSVALESGLQERVTGLKSELLDLRRRSIQYNIFQRDVDTNRQLYDGLLQRYKEIGIAGGVGTNNIAIVDPADVPRAPSSPRLLLNLAIALLVGLILAGAVTFALEQIDEAIKDPSELDKATGLPTLGVIPTSDGDPLVMLQDRKSSAAEAYLSVQTNLAFTSDHGVPKTIAVTSTRASEGKSTTSYAIALTLARTNRRVVLVDCDMRSPSVHTIVGIANERGLSNFLSGDDDIRSALVAIPSLGITVLTAGAAPPSAAELLTGPRLALLFDQLLEHFDHVIVDCPPVLGLADAPLVAGRVEGVVYAVKARGARARLVRQAIARLQSANGNLVGAVLTMFEVKRAHYGYGYDYGYGYGSDSKKKHS